MGRRLLARLLAVEQEALASLGGPGGNAVADLGDLLGLQVARQILGIDGIGTEPEILLGVEEFPAGELVLAW